MIYKFTIKLVFLIILISVCNNLSYSLNEIDSLNLLMSKAKEQDKPGLFNNLASKYWFSEPQKSFSFSREALRIAVKYNSEIDQAVALNTIGVTFLITNKNDSALFYLYKSLSKFEQLKDTIKIANNLRALGDVYSGTTDFNKAQEYYLKSYKLFEEVINNPKLSNSDINKFAILLNNFAGLKLDLENYEDAKKYFEISVKYYEKINSMQGLSIAYFNISLCWEQLKNKLKREEYLNKAYKIALENNILSIQSNVLSNFGKIYFENGEMNKAKLNVDKSIILALKLEDKTILYNNYVINGKIYSKLKDLKKGLNNFEIALRYSLESDSKSQQIEVLKHISDVYLELKDYKKSRDFFEKHINLKDSVFTLEKAQKLNQIDKKFNLERKEKENEKLLRLNDVKEFNNNRLWIINISLIIIVSFGVIILIVLRKRNNIKEKLNNVLNEKNIEMIDKNKELEISNSTKDMFFSIIAHDLKNPLGNFKQVTDILTDDESELSEKEKAEFLELMRTSAHNLYNLLENLLEWSSSQKNLIVFNPSQFDLYLIAQENTKMFELAADHKNIKIINNVKVNSIVKADLNMIKTTIRNLVSNAIKFTPPQGTITINSIIENGIIRVSISDTGVGMSDGIRNKLFKIEEKVTSLGTNQESGTGLGLILCKEFIDKHYGKIWVESELGKGSTFTFSLPLI
ncbi:MAG: tetratricopeptide repeat-containing sensor histidine kinase [Candidatus Kapabacteria bacterium]|nr:tetratricopeptide repeat-containing sensor histidine kinase [Candidatus Kapabacteria bacterium]